MRDKMKEYAEIKNKGPTPIEKEEIKNFLEVKEE